MILSSSSMILDFLFKNLGFPRLCMPSPPFPFPRTTVLVPTPSVRTGERFRGRPARPPPLRRSTLDPDILPPPPTPHALYYAPPPLTPITHSNVITASGSDSALTGKVAVGRGYRGCEPRDHCSGNGERLAELFHIGICRINTVPDPPF